MTSSSMNDLFDMKASSDQAAEGSGAGRTATRRKSIKSEAAGKPVVRKTAARRKKADGEKQDSPPADPAAASAPIRKKPIAGRKKVAVEDAQKSPSPEDVLETASGNRNSKKEEELSFSDFGPVLPENAFDPGIALTEEERRAFSAPMPPSLRAGFRINFKMPEVFPEENDDNNPLTRKEKVELIQEYFPFLRHDIIIRAPFAKGFRDELIERAPKGVSRKTVEEALRQKINTLSYQALIAHYVQRRHLDGSLAEEISEFEAKRARHVCNSMEIFLRRIGVMPHDLDRVMEYVSKKERGHKTRIPAALIRNPKEVRQQAQKEVQQHEAWRREEIARREAENAAYGGAAKKKEKRKKERKKNELRLASMRKEAERRNEEYIEAVKNGEKKLPKIYTGHVALELQMEAERRRLEELNEKLRLKMRLPPKNATMKKPVQPKIVYQKTDRKG